MIESQVRFCARLPSANKFPPQTLLIYDQRLARTPGFASWSKGFAACWAVKAGESLKDAHGFPGAVEKLARIANDWSPREMAIASCGGGSVGDFSGFLASVFKRGVRLEHLPSTWLAAIDSAHGGKTALNVGGFKNQVGTYYPSAATWICRELLTTQPTVRAREAMSELAKVALLDGGAWARRLRVRRGTEATAIWGALRDAIEAKMEIVRLDPYERSGERQILNFGHTFGHAVESELGIPHGAAIAYGLRFAVDWSAHRGDLPEREAIKVRLFIDACLGVSTVRPLISTARLRDAIGKDKKRAAGGTTFIFLRAWGEAKREVVALDEIVNEARRQGWIKR